VPDCGKHSMRFTLTKVNHVLSLYDIIRDGLLFHRSGLQRGAGAVILVMRLLLDEGLMREPSG